MKIYEAKVMFNVVREGDPDPVCDTPAKMAEYMTGAFDEDPLVEWFYVIALNRKMRPLGRTMITKGIASSSLVHPREVMRPLILSGASAFVCVHNHPSGDPSPSAADIKVTHTLREAAKIMGIEFLDHIILGDAAVSETGQSYYSFEEAGVL